MNDWPIRMKPDDSLPPPEPQQAGIEHMALLRAMVDEAKHLRDLFTRGGDDLLTQRRLAQSRSIELFDQASRTLESGEGLMQSLRYHGWPAALERTRSR